jgi:hypothetical protein
MATLLGGVVHEAEDAVVARPIPVEGVHLLFGPPINQPTSDVTCVAKDIITRNIKEMQNDWLQTNMASGLTNRSGTELCASHSTSTLVAVDEPLALSLTRVPCVEISTMAVRNAQPDRIFPIVTKLKADAWELALKDAGILEEFSDIPVGLRQGFSCGLENFSLSRTSVPRNHYTSQEDEDFVVSKYAEEIALGRISHGYVPDVLFSLIGHFRTAPLAVVDHGGGKRRVIVNHSYPKNEHCINFESLPRSTDQKYIIDPMHTSINTVIDSKKFQCAWGSFAECYLLVADAPVGTQAAVFDVDAAFRNIPTHPSARRFLAIMIKDLIHLDHVLNFGASPSPGIFGRVADAMVKVLLHRGVEAIIKWVDDFIVIRYPLRQLSQNSFEFSYSADLIWDIAEELGWPWAPAKFADFATKFTYIGFTWDLSLKQVELPERKKLKYLERIATWTPGSHHTAKEAERVIGTLNHVCLVVPEGRSHLVSLYKFRGGFKSHHVSDTKHKLSTGSGEDMLWWKRRLQEAFVGMKIFRPPQPLNTALFVDASTGWGIGLVLDGKWLAWQLKEGWKSDGREIGWAEMVAVELAIRTLVTGKFSRCHIIIRSDNKGVVGAMEAGRSRGTQQNLILREIVRLIQDHEIWISVTWVPTLDNPADNPSRGIFPGKDQLYAYPPKLPYHLVNFLHRAVHYHDSRLH